MFKYFVSQSFIFLLKDLCKIIIWLLIYKLQDVLECGLAHYVCRRIPKSIIETERFVKNYNMVINI